MIAFVVGLFTWAWGLIGPWAVWAWANAAAPALQGLLHSCGVMYLFERSAKWWHGE